MGKTHLAISLTITPAESGRKIYFGSLTDLVNSLEEAKAAGRLDRRLKILTHPALLVVDEIGYLPVTQGGAVLDRLLHPLPHREHPGQQLPHAPPRRTLQGTPPPRQAK